MGFCVTALTLWGCSGDGHGHVGDRDVHAEDHGDEHAAHADDPDAHAAEHSEASALKLNDGRKWVMDGHTRRMFVQMESTLGARDFSTLEGVRATGQRLDGEMSELIRGCTMTGPAHDELHVFLMDFMPVIAGLGEAAGLEAGRAQAAKAEALLETYREYFE